MTLTKIHDCRPNDTVAQKKGMRTDLKSGMGIWEVSQRWDRSYPVIKKIVSDDPTLVEFTGSRLEAKKLSRVKLTSGMKEALRKDFESGMGVEMLAKQYPFIKKSNIKNNLVAMGCLPGSTSINESSSTRNEIAGSMSLTAEQLKNFGSDNLKSAVELLEDELRVAGFNFDVSFSLIKMSDI